MEEEKEETEELYNFNLDYNNFKTLKGFLEYEREMIKYNIDNYSKEYIIKFYELYNNILI